MDIDISKSPTPVMAETILTVALKLLGVYLLYTAIFHSATLMSAMFSFSSLVSNSSQLGIRELAPLVISSVGTILTVAMAMALIGHGGRAAHWFAVRPDLQVPIGNPTRQWYTGSFVFIGVWVLVTNFTASLYSVTWAVVDVIDPQDFPGVPDEDAFFLYFALHSATALAIGLGIIFGAFRLGDWFYRLSGADRDVSTATETQ